MLNHRVERTAMFSNHTIYADPVLFPRTAKALGLTVPLSLLAPADAR